MKLRFASTWAACFTVLVASVAGVLFAVDASLAIENRETFRRLLAGSGNLLFILGVFAFAGSGFLAQWLTSTYFGAARRLSQSTRLIASGNPGHRVDMDGPAELRELAAAINVLATRHEETLSDVASRVARARVDVDQEKNRLAALMSELAQSVVVCNADGRILLYNERARRMLMEPRSEMRDVPAYVGLGRSLFALLDKDLVSHALEQLHSKVAQHEAGPVVTFMAALRAGKLVRAQMAPVAAAQSAEPASAGLAGFVLLFDDIGDEISRAEQRDQLLQRLTQNVRTSLASMRAAVENLMHYPDMDAARREQFVGIISQEADRLTVEVDRATRDYSQCIASGWVVDQIRVTDLIEVIRRRVESRLGFATDIETVDVSLWISADSFSVAQAVCYLAQRLKEDCAVQTLRFAAAGAGRYARLDLIWTGPRLAASTVRAWESGVLGGHDETSAVTFRDVLNRHHGEAWYESDPVSERACYRLLLPLAQSGKPMPAVTARPGRPEYYDFDLFHQPGQTRELDDRELGALTYTVFDTETTGLEPSAGDEIISIGAVRIVNGRLLTGEVFEQLVDPRRPLRAESIRIHGIQPGMLHGQPAIEQVLPAFHRFCEDTVLVGHNAAFDMRFLQLKQSATGVHFTQPVLDTLLLSAVLHDNLATHQLDAIAERFGVNVVGRHTAVGDAIMTGEIFLKMIPLLAERRIVTLRQAREASERTYHARVTY
jgi:DNA polymerase III subunit epsilon